MTLAIAILLFVTLQRLAELVIAQRNTERLLNRGAVEKSPEHYLVIVVLHASWLVGLWWFAPGQDVNVVLLGVFGILQALRIWVLVTLGDRWTTRIIVLPGEKRITHGPFRFISHPNYAVVVAEIAVLPLVFGLVTFAVVFSLLNAAILVLRIKAENAALSDAESGGMQAASST
ncbi:MAG: isoprenylcysteine carboxylmethyltransferase family protein [Pseudomonadota bacterium]